MVENLLELQTVQSNVIKILCDVLKETLNDINFIFDEHGIKVMAMDGSHVALIHLKLHASKFEYYKCTERMQVGLNMSNLFKLIKTVTNLDTITFYIASDNRHEFCINIENADKNSKTTFKLKMLDIDETELRIPDIELQSVITMPSNDFQRMCRDMINISDLVIMTSCANTFTLSCEGDFASQETQIGEANHGLTFLNCDEKISGKFSLRYLNLFTKSTNLSNTLDIYLKKDFPLMLKYNVSNLGEILFCLAPTMD